MTADERARLAAAPRFRFQLHADVVVRVHVEDAPVLVGERVFVETAERLEQAKARAARGKDHGLPEPVPGYVRGWYPLVAGRLEPVAILVALDSYLGPVLADPDPVA